MQIGFGKTFVIFIFLNLQTAHSSTANANFFLVFLGWKLAWCIPK